MLRRVDGDFVGFGRWTCPAGRGIRAHHEGKKGVAHFRRGGPARWAMPQALLQVRLKVDVSMLAWAGAIIGALYALGFGIFWWISPPYPGLAHWSAASFGHSAAMILMTLRSVSTDPWLTRVLPTWLLLFSAMMLFIGATRFAGRRVSLGWPVTVYVLAGAAFAWLLVVEPQPRVRQVVNSAVMAGFLILAAIELFRERREGLRSSAIFNGCFVFGIGSWFVFRGIRAMAFGYVELFEPGGLQLLNMAISGAYVLGALFGTILMVHQRQLVAIREANGQLLAAKDQTLVLERRLLAERSHRQRRGLLRDLHDGLAGVTAHIALATSSPAAIPADGPLGDRIRQLRELATTGHRELRLLMDMLDRAETFWREPMAELRAHAMNILVARGIEARWDVHGPIPMEAVEDAAAMFSLLRVVKEAVNNAAKHSNARLVRIRFRFRPGVVGIQVRDDGVGTEVARPGPGGRGMTHMSERVRELGGRLRIQGQGGTCVRMVVPLPLEIRPTDSEGPSAGTETGGGGI